MGGEDLREQVRRRAEFLKEMGLDYAIDAPVLRAAAKKPAPPPASEPRPSPPPKRPAPAPPAVREAPPRAPSTLMTDGESGLIARVRAAGDSSEGLKLIREEIGDCRRCRLCEHRNTIVFGVGSPSAQVLFIGEGPGADEDAQGEPFVGRAGQLLTDIITKGMGLKRSDVYIANVVKCRPPGNREPQPDEVAQCFPFLDAQIAAIRPAVLVALGKSALQALLAAPVQITKVRGQWTNYKGTPLMPTFHPSYLLRNPAAKRDVWQDIQEVMKRAGIPPPQRGTS